MSDKTEAGCWLVDWWRQTKTSSSTISPKNHKAWMKYVIDINVMAAPSRCQPAVGPHDGVGKEHRTITRGRLSSD
jgi:hypothetical protein